MANMTRHTGSASVLQRPLSEVLAQLSPPDAHRAGLGACLGCAVAPFETLADAVRILRLERKRVVAALAGKVGR